MIAPGGQTSCSDGSDYHFFVREADPEKLLFYLQGGGACWSRQTCDAQLQPSYTINVEKAHPASRDGIVNYANPQNPLADYSAVFVPYCTGDVHLGARDAEYPPLTETGAGSGTLNIRHRGSINVQAALDYTAQHFPRAQRIFVTGSSAGAIPSPWYALKMAERYPDARVVQLGDGAGGYRRTVTPEVQQTNPLPLWDADKVLRTHPAFADLNSESFNYEMLYIRAGRHNSDIQLAAYDTAEDIVQKHYLGLSGASTDTLHDMLLANRGDVREQLPNFKSYIAGGELHTVLLRPEFYTYAVGKQSVRDWVAALVAGEPVQDTECSDCLLPDHVASAPAPESMEEY